MINIENSYDMITCRFLLSLSIGRFAEILGVSRSSITRIENRKAEPSKCICLGATAALLNSKNADYRVSVYNSLNRKRYVDFLYKQTGSGLRLPTVTEYLCGCEEPDLSFAYGKRYSVDGDLLGAEVEANCSTCGHCGIAESKAIFRELQIAVVGRFNPYRELNYDHRALLPYEQKLRGAAFRDNERFTTVRRVETATGRVAARFVLSLSQEQLAQELGAEISTIRRAEFNKGGTQAHLGLGLRGLLMLRSLKEPWLIPIFESVDHDEYVTFLESVTKFQGTVPQVKHPTCPVCNSMNFTTSGPPIGMTRGVFGFRCDDCSHTVKVCRSNTLKRIHHMRINESINLMNADWYTTPNFDAPVG